MNKKLIGMILVFSLITALFLPVYAEEEADPEVVETVVETLEPEFLDISTVDEFLLFAEACRLDSYSIGLVVTLKRDIDLTGIPFSGVPIFSGYFNGDGHEIKGVEVTGDGSYQGLFRYLTMAATVADLKLEMTAAPGGSANCVGAVAGENLGKITDCAVVADVSGNSYVGGVAGINGVTGLIEDCTVRGYVIGTHQIGGIAGENLGVIRGCTNRAAINMEAKDNAVDLSDITLEAITGSEAIDTSTDIGGIAGRSTGVIRKCNNHGDIGYAHMGYNVGGIAGTQAGHIANCVNYGTVNGRKEVGGIVGQMEPIAYIEFSVDVIQMLREQLGEISGLVDKASANASGGAGAVVGQIGALQDQTDTAVDALEELVTGDMTDMDAIIAAQNTLTSALTQMPGTVEKIAGAVQSMVGGLGRDLNLISEHIGAMTETLNEASENIGGTVTDISDLDTDELLAGKILSCYNRGEVLGDLSVGGIAGAMAFENDMDILEDLDVLGEESANFDSKIRAVILGCENYGAVTGGKRYVGGVVGWQTLGLVRSSGWSGKVKGTGADNVGGVSGFSVGYIRSCFAKGQINGNTCVGGIAGSAAIVTDCVASVRIGEATEKFGAILGVHQTSEQQEEQPLSNNHYLPIGEDIGAIDAISYDGRAQSVTLDEFKVLPTVPHLMRVVTVRFVFEDGETQDIMLDLGMALEKERIPQVPYKHGFTGEWEGLADADLDHILYDMTFNVRYGPHGRSMQSVSEENGKPIVLAEGLFGFDAALDISQEQEDPELGEKEVLLRAGSLRLSGEAEVTALHLLLPEDEDPELLKVFVRSTDGAWREVAHRVVGSYTVFDWSVEDISFALVREEARFNIIHYVAAAGVVLLAAIVITVAVRSRKKKQISEE